MEFSGERKKVGILRECATEVADSWNTAVVYVA